MLLIPCLWYKMSISVHVHHVTYAILYLEVRTRLSALHPTQMDISICCIISQPSNHYTFHSLIVSPKTSPVISIPCISLLCQQYIMEQCKYACFISFTVHIKGIQVPHSLNSITTSPCFPTIIVYAPLKRKITIEIIIYLKEKQILLLMIATILAFLKANY